MNKFLSRAFNFVSDVSVVVGSAVGVGLISGKETQVFTQTVPNILIFAVVYAFVVSIYREFCRKNAVSSTAHLAQVCFGKFSVAFNFALCLCAFVCIVTCLAGVEQCLSSILYLSALPLYAVCVAFCAAIVMAKGFSALKICNVVSLAMTVVLFVLMVLSYKPSASATAAPQLYMPVIYALFNFTMSLSLTCKLGAKSCKRQNVIRSVISAVIIAVAIIVTTFIADFSAPLPALVNLNGFTKFFAVFTISLTSMCGIVGCALPVTELVDGVVGDKTVSSALVFCFACALSMIGFDFLVKFGYVFVALIGLIVAIVILLQKHSKRNFNGSL